MIEFKNGTLSITDEKISGYSPTSYDISAIIDGNKVFFDAKLIIRLYEGFKWNFEKNNPNIDFTVFCDNLFKVNKND